MASYSKMTSENGTVRYKDGNKFVAADKVSDQAKSALEEQPEGTQVDELGDVIDPSTETDDSEDEDAPTNTNEDEDTADDEPAEEEAPATAAVPQDEEGFGFPRRNGKTTSIFSNKPHEVVRYVSGVMVPLTRLEAEGDPANDVAPKSDAEIIAKLKKMKKL